MQKEVIIKNIIKDLKVSNPNQWYSKLKRMMSYDQRVTNDIVVDEICHLSDQEQAEHLAEHFSSVSREYKPLKSEDIHIPHIPENTIPLFTPFSVLPYLKKIKINKSNVLGDIPARIIKDFSEYICLPYCDILNTMVKRGEYPYIWKKEIQTPVPKVFPPTNVRQLRNISGLLNFDKVAQSIFGEMITSDMQDNIDPSQYGNQRKTSIQHYLMKMIHTILLNLDGKQNRGNFAVIASLIDWQEAFPRQCHKLGTEAFLKMGVRPALLPMLVNFFQDRRMSVKWHGKLSETKLLNGSGPQGSTIGLLEYLAQSNKNANCVDPELRYKFIDDLTILEIVNLLTIGISSYNIKTHIPSDIPTHNQYIKGENLKSQSYINTISDWTEKQQMKLNHKKSNIMIFNYSKKSQFTTRLAMEGEILPVVKKTKLLGTIITDDLRWEENTSSLVKKANARLLLLRKAKEYTNCKSDLKIIYISYIRSILEQSSVIWHSSLTSDNQNDIERIQKNALRIILGDQYKSYKSALNSLQIESLIERREQLALKFAKNCIDNEKTKALFPLREKKHQMQVRKNEKYKVLSTKTERLKNSTVPYLQRLLNKDDGKKK